MPDANTLLDRKSQKVQVRSVVPLPDLSPQFTIDQAKQTLVARDLQSEVNTKYRNTDRVLRYQVLGDQFEINGLAYTRPGTTVKLHVGRQVPDIATFRWDDGVKAIEIAGLDWGVPEGQPKGTHVYKTQPLGNTIMDVERAVVLHPGIYVEDVRGQSEEKARLTLNALSPHGIGVQIVSSRDVETDDILILGTNRIVSQEPVGLQLKADVSNVRLESESYVPSKAPITTIGEFKYARIPQYLRCQLSADRQTATIYMTTKQPDGRIVNQYPIANQFINFLRFQNEPSARYDFIESAKASADGQFSALTQFGAEVRLDLRVITIPIDGIGRGHLQVKTRAGTIEDFPVSFSLE
jgi:hypothetical protein